MGLNYGSSFDLALNNVAFKLNGVDLGALRDTATLTVENTRKDVFEACFGINPKEQYYTGTQVIISGTLAGISVETLGKLEVGQIRDDSDNTVPETPVLAMALTPKNQSKVPYYPMTMSRCIQGLPSTAANDQFHFYEVSLMIDGSLYNFGADNERSVAFQMICRPRVFTAAEVPEGDEPRMAIFYHGDPTLIGTAGIPAVVHP